MLKKREICIADESGMMSLTLWDNLSTDDISINFVYFIKNVATRCFFKYQNANHYHDQNALQETNDEMFQSASEISRAEGEKIKKQTTNCFS
jgi:hypothetical protein